METNVRWSWSDLVSSYRFWGLIMFSFSIISFKYFILFYLPNHLMQEYGYQFSQIEMLMLGSNFYIVTVLSIIPAWIASRVKTYYFLQLYAFIILIALLITYCYLDNLLIVTISILVIGVFGSAISLLIAGILAKAINSIEFFVLAFGFVLFINAIYGFSSPISISMIVYQYNTMNPIFFSAIIQIVIGMLLLLPVKKSLFNDAPPIRQYPATTKKRYSPLVVFLLLICIPFYIIYWCVRVHRDIRNYSQSAKLLTPTAAGWCSALVPFAIPVMLVILSDVTDEYLSKSKRSRWGLILLSLFLLPVAIALVQSRLNQLPHNSEL